MTEPNFRGRTVFERVERPASARKRWGFVAALLAVLGVVAASNIEIVQKEEFAGLAAERYDVGEGFAIAGGTVWPAKQARAALGVEGAPVEIAAGLPDARTLLPKDQWVYTFHVRETGTDTVQGGNFTVELFLDEATMGRISVAQGTREGGAVEGVKASFGIGPELSTSSLYYIVVAPVVQTGPVAEFTVESHPDRTLRWRGVGGSIEGQVNPGLTVAAGSTVRLTAKNSDDIPHNIGIKDAANNLVTPPGWSPDFESTGQQALLSWTPSAPGAYAYECRYHATTMRGTVTVV